MNYKELFEEYAGIGDKKYDASDETIEKYRNIFKGKSDKSDILIDIWKSHGFATYLKGLFTFVNPDSYSSIARKFPNISDSALVFGKSSVGNLFIFDYLDVGNSILFLNIHHGTSEIIGTSFEILLAVELGADSFWKRECYGKFELKVLSKYGSLEYDKSYVFVPSLSLGGNEHINNMDKVDTIEHLAFLSQLY